MSRGSQGTLTLIELLHPGPSGATVLAAAAYMVVSCGFPGMIDRIAALTLVVALHQAATSLHNDWCDRDLDALTKPWRAIPSGAVSATVVRQAAFCLALTAIIIAWATSVTLLFLTLLATVSSFAYNSWLKRTIISWLPFAVAFPLVPLAASAACQGWPRLWWALYILGLPSVLAFHLADTLPDLRGDAKLGVRGLSHRLGYRGTLAALVLTLSLSVLATLLVGLAGASVFTHISAAAGMAAICLVVGVPSRRRLAGIAGAGITTFAWSTALLR